MTTGSTALTGAAFLLGWLPRRAAFTIGGPLVDHFRADRVFRGALAVLPAAGIAATTVVMTVGAAGGLPRLLLACAVLQGAAMALAFRGLWHHRASYTPSRTAADPAGTGHPAAAQADAPRTA